MDMERSCVTSSPLNSPSKQAARSSESVSSRYGMMIGRREESLICIQTWKNNMTKDADAEVFKSSGDDFTKVTFKPDLKKFKMSELDDDIIALMCRYVTEWREMGGRY